MFQASREDELRTKRRTHWEWEEIPYPGLKKDEYAFRTRRNGKLTKRIRILKEVRVISWRQASQRKRY